MAELQVTLPVYVYGIYFMEWQLFNLSKLLLAFVLPLLFDDSVRRCVTLSWLKKPLKVPYIKVNIIFIFKLKFIWKKILYRRWVSNPGLSIADRLL